MCVLVINPGSTSTKVAVYKDDKLLAAESIDHDEDQIRSFASVNEQLEFRKQVVERFMTEKGYDLSNGFRAIAARGGCDGNLRAGAYLVTEALVEMFLNAMIPHASNLGAAIAFELSKESGIPAYIYDAEGVDEFYDHARLSGLPELPINPSGHVLNSKAVSRICAQEMGGKYEDFNFIVVHLGGGISVSAHKKGRIVDSVYNAYTPDRANTLPTIPLIRYCYSGQKSLEEILASVMSQGGLTAYLGTNSLKEVEDRINDGDAEAKFYFEGMIFQVAKDVGELATVLYGQVDGIILTGGMAKSEILVDDLMRRISFLGEIIVKAGSFEEFALASGVYRVLNHLEKANIYEGSPQ